MKPIVIFATAAALAGCSGHGAGDNQAAAGNAATGAAAGPSAAPAASASAAPASGGLPMRPGAWEMAIRMDMPDMPPEVRAHLGNNGTITRRTCMTPEKLSDANRVFLAGGSDQGGVHCDTSGLHIGGGRIDGAVSCAGAQGQPMRIAMTGTLGATEYELDQRVEGPQGAMSSHVVARRVGDCTPQEIAAANADRSEAGAAAGR